MTTKKSPPELSPTDAADAIAPTLVAVLQYWAKGVYLGRLARADLPSAGKLRDLPPWAAAWSQLSDDQRAALAPWWDASPLRGSPFA
jgi:hypothetical protein